jgi:hypothetical protein
MRHQTEWGSESSKLSLKERTELPRQVTRLGSERVEERSFSISIKTLAEIFADGIPGSRRVVDRLAGVALNLRCFSERLREYPLRRDSQLLEAIRDDHDEDF